MKRFTTRAIVFLSTLLLASAAAVARPAGPREEISTDDPVTDVVGDVDGSFGMPRKALADTIWIANWSFDGPGGCDDTGWEKVDNRIIADGQIHWSVEDGFGSVGGITGNAGVLGYTGSQCCVEPDGYDNDWYEAIRLQYTGNATLSFDYLLDSEDAFDFLQVETDSSCASFARVDYDVNPNTQAAHYRTVVFIDEGLVTNGTVTSLTLTNHGAGTHCVYLAFFSDGGFSPCDGLWPSTLGRALVVDNLQLTDAAGTTNLDFEGAVDPGIFVELHDSTPFGEWGRLYRHLPENDACTENTTCAWLWTDHTTPTYGNDPSLAFGPNGYVVRNWLDDVLISPWVSLASTQNAAGTVVRFRRFGGNFFNTSRILSRWNVRGRKVVSGQDCVADWFGGDILSQTLDSFKWQTLTGDITARVDPGADDIQLRHRVGDWQFIAGASPPNPFSPGPGPYLDDIRIGRIVLSGPVLSEGIDARSQAQDCFPTEIHPGINPGTGQHHRPTTDRFGTCAFSQGVDLGHGLTNNLVTGDSVWISVRDARNAGGVTAIEWHGSIVSGPHAGKAPAPYTVGANGFFVVTPDSVRSSAGIVLPGAFFTDLDDTYFRGGDVLLYLWLATDAMGGTTSDPTGLSGVPTSVEEAEHTTGGLLEVSFLPSIVWDPSYLARIGADPHGDLAPTEAEIAGSSQRHCVLYVNHINTRRRSGAVNRTTFMYTLDRLGYEYDVYDHTGMGNTNNHLGGRATVPQATGYSLIVYDAGGGVPGRPIVPTGISNDLEKVDQAGWFRSWLDQAATSEAGVATLWMIGSNALEEHPSNTLYTTYMGATLVHTSQPAALNPAVEGQTTFTFDTGTGSTAVDFTTGDRALFMLAAGCATPRGYDGLGITGSGVPVYRYKAAGEPPSDAALVMNSNPSAQWNTILQSHPWFHIHDPSGAPPTAPGPARDLAGAILAAVVPACSPGVPVDVPVVPVIAAPARTVLHPNLPNPFNPMTEIRFDLARSGRVKIRIYDVAGSLVRTLVDADMESGFGKRLLWNGLDAAGRRVASGLYFARLDTSDHVETRKMLLLQ